ncbi:MULTISPECIES: hypothetical protein [unclassified Acinetobacter]|uniref:hypothetical protein n=1 Tax=unclassified Acinetobacter TaxID=196816 RepID=UPI0015D1AE31|nr:MULTISPECIES: hypothetical protein [unclassified Acinetobacter]
MDKSVIINNEEAAVVERRTEFILVSRAELKSLYKKIKDYEERIRKYELQERKTLEFLAKKINRG